MEVDDISPEEKEQFYKGLEVDTPETRTDKNIGLLTNSESENSKKSHQTD